MLRRALLLVLVLILTACPATSAPRGKAVAHIADAPVLRLLKSTALATKLEVDRKAFASALAVQKPSALTWKATAATTAVDGDALTITSAADKFTIEADVLTTPGVQYLLTAKVTGKLDIEARGTGTDDEWEKSTLTGPGTLVVNVIAESHVHLRLTGSGNAALRSLTMREVGHRQPNQLLSAEDAAIRTYVRDDHRPAGSPGLQFRSRDREALLASGMSTYEWPLDPSLGARVLDFETIDVPRHADSVSPAVPIVATIEAAKNGTWTEVFRETRGGPTDDHHWHRQKVTLDHAEGIRLKTTGAGRTTTLAWGRPVIRPAQRSNAPDVVIITLDALRADRLGAYGSTAGLTPQLDALAEKGATFLEARTACGKTWESLTATAYATRPDLVGVRISGDSVTRGSTSIADVFADAGYVTARLGNVLLPPGHLGEVDIEEDDHDDPRALARLVEIMNEEHDRPVFAWLHLAATHYPYILDPEFVPPGGTPQLATSDFYKVVKDAGPPDAIAEISKRADIAVKQTDTLLGRAVFPALQKADRPGGPALVAIAADHGSHRGERGIWFMHATVNRSVLHVPLLFSWPGHLAPGTRSDRLVRLIDIGPTLLDLAGVAQPANVSFTGQSLRPLLEGRYMPRLMNRIVDLSTVEVARTKRAQPGATNPTSEGTTETAATHESRTHGVVVIEDDDHKAVAGDKAEYVFMSSGLRVKETDLALYTWRTDPNESHDVSLAKPLVAGELLSNVKGARATVQRHISPEAARLLRQAGYASPTDTPE